MTILFEPPRSPSDVRNFNSELALAGYPYGTQSGYQATIYEWEAHLSDKADNTLLGPRIHNDAVHRRQVHLGFVNDQLTGWTLQGEGIYPIFMWPMFYLNDTAVFAGDLVVFRGALVKVTLDNAVFICDNIVHFMPYITTGHKSPAKPAEPAYITLTYDQMVASFRSGRAVEYLTANLTWAPMTAIPALDASPQAVAGSYRFAYGKPQVAKAGYDPEDLTYGEVAVAFELGFPVLISDTSDPCAWRPTAFNKDTFTEAKYNVARAAGDKFKAVSGSFQVAMPSATCTRYLSLRSYADVREALEKGLTVEANISELTGGYRVEKEYQRVTILPTGDQYRMAKAAGGDFRVAIPVTGTQTLPQGLYDPADLTYLEACEHQKRGYDLQFLAAQTKGVDGWRTLNWLLERMNVGSYDGYRFRLTPNQAKA